MTFDEYTRAIMQDRPGEQRRGQYAFNLLFSVRPDISEQIRGTLADPFYQDRIIPAFLAFVEANW